MTKNNSMKEKVIDAMITDIIRRYGFEHETTIIFCKVAEDSNNLYLIKKLFRKFMSI